MQRLRYRLPNNDTLCWRRGDFSLFFILFVVSFGVAMVLIYNVDSDWWVLPWGIGEVCLFLFIICKKVDKGEN